MAESRSRPPSHVCLVDRKKSSARAKYPVHIVINAALNVSSRRQAESDYIRLTVPQSSTSQEIYHANDSPHETLQTGFHLPDNELTPVSPPSHDDHEQTPAVAPNLGLAPESAPSLIDSVIMTDGSLSSSQIFDSRIRDLLDESPRQRREGKTHSVTHSYSSPEVAHTWPGAQNSWASTSPKLPKREEAYSLLGSVDFFIGQTQHYFDIREISDQMALFFDGKLTSPASRLWYLKILLVMAIGKLFRGDSDGSAHPGNDLSQRHGIEVLSLMAVYLQNVNRKEEAYLYTNSALLIAITHNFHRLTLSCDLLSSHKIHLSRLWWTIYMNDKRLAAATGNPSGVSHDVVDVDMPYDALGFAPASPILLNIRIAQITGRILATLYKRKNPINGDLTTSVHSIMHQLQDISTELPLEFLKADKGVTPQISIRTSASLHLMFYQKNIIAIFGFFDLDAAFSAGFVMVLARLYNTICGADQALYPAPGLDEALEVLRYLSDRGNSFAAQRLNELEKRCSQIEVHQTPHTEQTPRQSVAQTTQRPTGFATPVMSNDPDSFHSSIGGIMGRESHQTPHVASAGTSRAASRQPTSYWQQDHQNDQRGTDSFDWASHTGANDDILAGLSLDASLDAIDEQYRFLCDSTDWPHFGDDSVDFTELVGWLPGF
ncbi:hypothetical protein N7456_012036 [Penicillium angulare]|uniref:Xylanolytic transcriptional activator regulatory domain-containing protein n=1 Tax=Penicillium angulare TaxID=116970 RepID=A0A9W9EV46_9EURO|nr:hypothetical protein N7456_012036 [Penicillium angulare]